MGQELLGCKMRDKVTGLEGTAICYAIWKNWCNRYAIQPACVKDGAAAQMHWVDEQDAEVITPEEAPHAAPARTGGPQADPSGFSADPTR